MKNKDQDIRVKMFSADTDMMIESYVNNFIKLSHIHVKDLKYSTVLMPESLDTVHHVLIMYIDTSKI